MEKDLTPLERRLGVTFKNQDMLRQAVVHRSYLNEHRDFALDHNERLEFLGDAVLELIVTENLYRNYPNPEGELTNWRAALVNSQMLSVAAAAFELDHYLYLSRGESQDQNSKARQSILANAFEAIIGAIYLDHGFETAKTFIEGSILKELPRILENKLYLDAKSRFQEAAQEHLGVTPTYEVLEETGPDHDKQFVVGVFIGEEMIAQGDGSSKHEAQFKAAEKGLAAKGWK
ncbi:MAG: ribonuclease III [Candidatus Kerfeldbacteria bacterium]|nr:ribonuclease III [Candidatus Kerfeldbacteria bacterium]